MTFLHTRTYTLPPCSACLPFALALLCCVLFFASPLHAEEDADALGRIWSSRLDDMDAFISEVAELRTFAEQLAKPLAQDVQHSRELFSRLNSLYQASRGHPTEQLTLVEQMRTAIKRLQAAIAPLDAIAATIQGRLEEITTLEGNLKNLPQQSDTDEAYTAYRQALAQARQKLSPAALRVDSILAPAKLTLENFTRSIEDIEKGLNDIWESYYLTASDNSLDALASTPALLGGWLASLDTRLAFAYPQNAEEWADSGKRFFLSSFIMALLGFLAFRGARNLPQRWSQAVSGVISRSWVWVALGLSFLAASTNKNGGIYMAFVLSGSLIIIAGVAALSWRLRIAVAPVLVDKPSPLWRLYPPAAAGVIMLFSDLPSRILGIAWGLSMLAFLAMMFFMNQKHKEEGSLPLLERFLNACGFWFGLASLLVALAGYARLAILLFMLLFALVNTLTLANALNALFDLQADRLSGKQSRPVANALLRALAIPVAWVVSLICTLPWVWAVPGARYLVDNAMKTNYTVGDASFDFSRLAAIVVLFFVARSLISLGQATLQQLPERVPSMEKGVIPPLSNLVTYGLWALFALFSLGLLGVNFTSLAVVAGGLSVGIGFGMQNIFNNLVSGLLLIFGRSILVGDYVEVAGSQGTVREISIRSTTLETTERALIYVPNSTFMSGQFTNWTRNSRMVRRSLLVGVAYGTDTALVRQLLLDAAKAQDHILQLPAPTVYFTDFGASSLDFTMNVFIDDFDNAVPTLSELRFTVERLFAENNIDIPFPQMTLHVEEQGGTEQVQASMPKIVKTEDTAQK